MIEAHIRDDLLIRGHRLVLIQRFGDVVQLLDPDGRWQTIEPGVALSEDTGIPLPEGAWAAICDTAHPSHGAAEVRRLEDALDIERERVDRILAALLDREA